ncbi:MAG TPA: hypothetical protein DCR60_02285 [Psychrobacter sp.]|nr:hypothetical protein [Psychrobacter sp.]|tara:strand:- start:1740 stop:2093 length:354 start_codon:yes stop_codon:yes gene_type:complete
MSNISKLERLISYLIQETIENSIKWKIQTPPESLTKNTDAFYPLFLITQYKDKSIGLYEQRFKSYEDEDVWFWATRPGLCIFTDNYISYKYEKRSPALNDLFLKAADQVSGIDKLLD